MKSLILGSSGQVGSALCEHLENKNQDVIYCDIINSPDQDLRERNIYLENSMKECDYVYFLAFDVGGSTYLQKYQETFEFIDNNVRLMSVVFESLKKYKKPFLFASSQMSTMGFSNYGLLKAIGEKYTNSLGGLVVKFWNVYGIEHDPEKTHVITDFIEMASKNLKINMRTTGTEVRQFLYSKDCAEALETLAIHDKKLPRDANYHVTNFEWTSILDIAINVASLYPGCKIIPGEKIDNVQQGQKNEPDPFILNYWKPKTSIQEGIKQISQSIIK